MPNFSIYNKCNNNCIMCTNPDRFRNMKQGFGLPYLLKRIDRFYRNKKEFLENYHDVFSISGGEPTLYPHLNNIIIKINKLFPKARIVCLTNGRKFAYPDYTKEILNLNTTFLELAISIHGDNARLHDEITQTPGSFSQTINGLKNIFKFKRSDQIIEIRVVIHKMNYKFLEKITKFIKTDFPNINRLVFIFFEMEGQAYRNLRTLKLTYTQLFPYFNEIYNLIHYFPDVRFYHFPLCVLRYQYWSYTWHTLPREKIAYVLNCAKCKYKEFCMGIHIDYLKNVGLGEFYPPNESLNVKPTNDFYHPIYKVLNV